MTERKNSKNQGARRRPARKTPARQTTKRAKAQTRRRTTVTRRRNTRRSQPRWLRVVGGATIFCASAFAGVLFTGPVIAFGARVDPASTVVDEIAVQGLHRLDARIVASASGVARGEARSEIDTDAVERRISAHPWVRSATVLEAPVGPLVVRVEERTPQAVLRAEGSHRWRLVDETGTPFAAAREDDLRTLPHVSSASELPMNAPNPLLAQAVQIGRDAQSSGLMAIAGSQQKTWIPELRLPSEKGGEGWIIAAHGRAMEAVLGFDDLEGRLTRLARMLSSAPEALAGIGRVDLRFDDHAVMRVEEPASRKK
jgi:cell division protein FtsQ